MMESGASSATSAMWCRTCGQAIKPPRVGGRSKELLKLVTLIHGGRPPRRWTGDQPWDWRSVYRGDNGNWWHLTYGGSLFHHVPFTFGDLKPLIEQGLLERTYPECADSYSPTRKAMDAARGFFSSLTPTQREAALSYDGDDTVGALSELRKLVVTSTAFQNAVEDVRTEFDPNAFMEWDDAIDAASSLLAEEAERGLARG